VILATLAALMAAGLFAVASALQHRSAGLVSGTGGPVELGRFVVATARHPFWLLGSVADVVGLALHAFALKEGPLTLVQPLLVTGVVFALPLRQLLERRRPGRAELLWAAALAIGLVVFLLAATPANGTTSAPDPIPTVVSAAAIAIGMAICAVVGWRTDGERSAATLGVGAGLAFAGTAGLLKQVMDELGHGLGSVVTTWPLYVLLVVGAAGLVLNQLAFRAGPLRASLPAITTVDPIASLVIGVAVFDEHFRRTAVAITGETIGLAIVVAAVLALTRSDPTPQAARSGSAGPVHPT
jgi:drug/metabolite transporter (DMT)-like permease